MQPSLSARVNAAVVRAGNAVGDELFPLLVWLTVFGVTRLAPSLILNLSIAVPQCMDFPPLLRWGRRRGTAAGGLGSSGGNGGGASGLSVDELTARLADLINSTPSGTSRVDSGSAGASSAPLGFTSDAWTRATHRAAESLFSLFTFPQRFIAFLLFRHRYGAASVDGGHRPMVVKLLLRLVTSFTANWVHASGSMLYDTVVTYLSTRMGSWSNGGTAGFVLGNGGPGRNASPNRLSSGWRDLLVASCVSTGVNFILQTFWLEALTSAGEVRALGRRPAASGASAVDDPTSSFTHVVLSTLARLGSKDTLYRLGRMALQPSPSSLRVPLSYTSVTSTGGRASNGRTGSSASAPPMPAGTLPASAAAAATAAGPRGVSPSPAPRTPPARVFLSGGNAFVFALSGFRFAFYGDVQQLTTSAANCMTDALDLLLRQANQRAAAQRFRSVDAATLSSGHVWRPPVAMQAAGAATSSDVVLTPASSMQLLPIYLVNFAVGAGVGLVWRERRVIIAAGRKVPLVRRVLEMIAPLPPAPLKLPDALQELSPECHILLIFNSGRVEVVGEDHAAPIVKQNVNGSRDATVSDGQPAPASAHPSDAQVIASSAASAPPASAASAAAANGPVTAGTLDGVRARFVVAQDLFCPIKRTLMSDPVQTVDGFTYDRDGIEEWLRVHDTAPLTNLHLGSVSVRVNWEARRQIEELMTQYRTAMEGQ